MATTKRKASKSAVKSTTKRGVTKAKAKAKAGNTTKAKAAPAKAKGKTKPVAKAKTSKAAAKTMPVAKAKTSKAAAKTMPVAKAKTSKAAAKTKTKPSRDNAKQREFVQRLESAIALQHLGDNQGAVDAFMDIFVDFPDDARLPEEAGNISLYALNDPLKAVECYAKALPLVDDPTELCHKIGFAYASADDDENASRWFAQAHYHTPTHAPTFLEVAKLNMRSERFDDALAYFDTAWAHHVMDTGMFGGPSPHFQALVLMNQARIRLVHLDRVDDGLAGLRSLIADMGDLQRGRILAQELIDAGKPAVASRVLDAVLAEAPKDKEALAMRKRLKR